MIVRWYLKRPIFDFKNSFFHDFVYNQKAKYCPKCSAHPIRETPILKWYFANGDHPIRGCIGLSKESLFSNFSLHIKIIKCIVMNCASCNGSPQKISLQQLPFANEAKPHSRCNIVFYLIYWKWIGKFNIDYIDRSIKQTNPLHVPLSNTLLHLGVLLQWKSTLDSYLKSRWWRAHIFVSLMASGTIIGKIYLLPAYWATFFESF